MDKSGPVGSKLSEDPKGLKRILEGIGLSEDEARDLLRKIEAIFTTVIEAREWQEDFTAQEMPEVFKHLDKIETRTFGILILQVIKTVKLIISLMPAGRLILVALAVVTLLANYLDTGSLTTENVKEVIRKTGAGQLVEKVLEQIDEAVGLVVGKLDSIESEARSLMGGLQDDLDGYARLLDAAYGDLLSNVEEQQRLGRRAVFQAANSLREDANLAGNLQFLFAALFQEGKAPLETLKTIARRLV